MDEIKRMQLAAKLSEEDLETAGWLPDAAAVAASCSSWGVKAQLKFHQAEGVSWLIRRYVRGVNVILVSYLLVGIAEAFSCAGAPQMLRIVVPSKSVYQGLL
ncbi:hypothetical protein R1flu_005399 [Riccia fluitans]|uniref:Uncharacterized protein n=1 Tax=Riccia fluitans TaxID=41844 RepID=A0ABD1YT30_9MARC